MNVALKEGLKQLGRVALLAVIPVLILSLESGKFDWKNIAAVVAIAVLMAVDKMLHKAGKGKKTKSMMEGGITRF